MRRNSCCALLAAMVTLFVSAGGLSAADTQGRYYAYPAVLDRHNVLAPWYKGQNGQCDFRARIAAETLKRYPWAGADKAPSPAPEYIYNGSWKIAADGAITVVPIQNWANGDLGQRAAYVLGSWMDYYRYSGDAAAIAHLTIQADALLDHCLTPSDHPWPGILVSVPIKGKAYGKTDPTGWVQLDIVAEVGIQMIRAYELTGNTRWFEAAKHWGDLFAEKRSRQAGVPPWSRYVNPEHVMWEDLSTGGVVFILEFLDVLIRDGYTGKDNVIVEARNAGVAYLRDVLLPNWTGHDVWGRNYWDWQNNVQAENVTEFAVRYLMEHPKEFPNWRNDARNILTLFINRTCVSPSNGDTFHGAWAYPESSSCCGRSLWYGPMELASVYAEYAVLTGSEWAREMARRQMILSTYDCHETGVVEDGIDGGPVVAGAWFKIAHPMALKHVLACMAWMPDVFGAARENHILRSSSTITDVRYGKGKIEYATYDAPPGVYEVLRLAFKPKQMMADGKPLPIGSLVENGGCEIRELPCGDFIATIRHGGAKKIVVQGDDPQNEQTDAGPEDGAMTFAFEGNQVRLIGPVGPNGGLADVYLDDVKQLCGIDCWNPAERQEQLLYYRNGLANGKHVIRVEPAGKGNPLAKGSRVRIDAVQWSSETGDNGFGEGGGPKEPQRFFFGYTGREDYVDTAGNAWRPATEFVIRSGNGLDSVASSWWTNRTRLQIDGTKDPELYRYGVHGRDFWADFTVAPGKYHARLKFVETRNIATELRAITIRINGREVVAGFDIASTAGGTGKSVLTHRQGDPYGNWSGLYRAVDLVFNDIEPASGVISIRLSGSFGGEAIVQAIEIGPNDGGTGAKPVTVTPAVASRPASPDGNLLVNGGFEDGAVGDLGGMGKNGGGNGWTYVFAGAGTAYLWAESAYSIHPDWGLPVFHGGKEALRTHTEGCSHTIVYQDVAAKPKTNYTASAWVRADDLHGKGFGRDPCDSAGLRIQEIGKDGAVIVDHPKQAVTKAGDFTKVSFSFTSNPATVRIRFILDTVIACSYKEGHVTYDDCHLGEVK